MKKSLQDHKDGMIFLLAIVFLEGYVVLSSELLAIRQLVPFVGSSTDSVSIIIAAVLMPLAFGYYAGGKFSMIAQNGKPRSLRNKLRFNFFVALFIFFLGFSQYFMEVFFQATSALGLKDRIMLTSLHAGLFLVVPVYLLGQTIPLISNYFSGEHMARMTGRILCFSTFGSFMGSIFATLVLMTLIGVHNTVSVNFVILTILIVMLSKNKVHTLTLTSLVIALIGVYINSTPFIKNLSIIENNLYHLISVNKTKEGANRLWLNYWPQSEYNPESGEKFAYAEAIERLAIDPIRNAAPPKEILVIGAGAFTIGLDDHLNKYTFVDLDGSLLRVAEELIIKQKLGENKQFIVQEIRAFLRQNSKKYDLIIVDAYNGNSIPEQLVTREFFQNVKTHMQPGGVMVANVIGFISLHSRFARRLDNTLRSVFPTAQRIPVHGDYKLWEQHDETHVPDNVLYAYYDVEDDMAIYTDDRNTVFLDHQPPR